MCTYIYIYIYIYDPLSYDPLCPFYNNHFARDQAYGSPTSGGRNIRTGSDAGGLRFESRTEWVAGRSTPSLWRDKHPAIKGPPASRAPRRAIPSGPQKTPPSQKQTNANNNNNIHTPAVRAARRRLGDAGRKAQATVTRTLPYCLSPSLPLSTGR